MAMQALVIAHAAYGHNSFFKGNYLFNMWTDASSIIDYLVYAKNYVAECEERYGLGAVEATLDSCHALMNHGVDRYRRPQRLSLGQEQARRAEREHHLQQQVNDLWRTLPRKPGRTAEDEEAKFKSGSESVFNIFSGPLKDQTGAEKVKAGESMTGDQILSMDWFVEGVDGTIQK